MYRNPNDKTCDVIGHVEWPKYNGEEGRQYMNLGDTLNVEEKLFDERFSIWDSLFPINN